MDDVKERLRATSEQCLKAYESWTGGKKDLRAREDLMEAVHELRKVASRVEIDIAISERDEVTQRPIPIPPHRAAQGGTPRTEMDEDRNGGGRDPGHMRRRLGPGRGPRPATNNDQTDETRGNF